MKYSNLQEYLEYLREYREFTELECLKAKTEEQYFDLRSKASILREVEVSILSILNKSLEAI